MAQIDRSEGLVGNTGIKAPCQLASQTNMVLTGEQVIDGVQSNGSRVLLMGQLDSTKNGVWVTSTSAWIRATDFDGAYDVGSGTLVTVSSGSAFGKTQWMVSTADPITIGSTGLSFSKVVAFDLATSGSANVGPPSGGDDYPAYAAAIASLPSSGGFITVPSGAFILNTNPTWGTKNIVWNISPGASFTGTGTGLNKFPTAATNGYNIASGLFIQTQNATFPFGFAATNGLIVENLAPPTSTGASVAIYCAASGSSSNVNAHVWALNPLITAKPGAAGDYQCIEIDVNNYSGGTATTKGIAISGLGTNNIDIGIEIVRGDSTRYVNGINVDYCINGININNNGNSLSSGVSINFTPVANTLISGRQIANAVDSIFLLRKTDTTPSGYFFRGVDAANSSTLCYIDVAGNIKGSLILGANLRATSAAIAANAGEFAIGATTAGSAGAVSEYLICYLGGSVRKLALLAA